MQYPMAQRVFNFSAGPAVLPVKVLEGARQAVLELSGVGISILEISHRSKAFEAVVAEAKAAAGRAAVDPQGLQHPISAGRIELAVLDGADELVARHRRTADYILTGTWGTKAFQEGQREGTARAAWDGKAAQLHASAGGRRLAAYTRGGLRTLHVERDDPGSRVPDPAGRGLRAVGMRCVLQFSLAQGGSRPLRIDLRVRRKTRASRA